jgi:TatD DNase family protein
MKSGALRRTAIISLLVLYRTSGLVGASFFKNAVVKMNLSTRSFVDVGANLLDDRFAAGMYRGTFRHEPDLSLVLERARAAGVKRIILTAGTIAESKRAVETARKWNAEYPFLRFSCTVGVHPTRCQHEFVDSERKSEELLLELLEIARDGMQDSTVVAIGEIGLDYDRLEFCSKDVQIEFLKLQLKLLAAPTKLPLFLHNRSVGSDLYDVLMQNKDCWIAGGVVHSFDDTMELANLFIEDCGFYIGLNGCSLRTQTNLHVASRLPLDRILLETDCPYCEVRTTHAGYQYMKTHYEAKSEKKFERGLLVKSRQEPCHIVQVAEIIAGCKNLPLDEVAAKCYENSLRLYGWGDD